MVQQIVDGKWRSSIYRAGLKDGVVNLAPFGDSVPADVRKLATDTKDKVLSGEVMPFQGPVKDQTGKVRIEAGKRPTTTELETTDYLVEGVVGTIPR